MASIYVPGRGQVDLAALRVDKAVNEYDERLFFGRNMQTGDWCIFLRNGPVEPPLPILGFGQEIPEPEAALRRLYQADTLRHGEEILDDMNRRNAAIKQKFEDAASEAEGMAAEGMEWFLRKEVPKKVPYMKSFGKRGQKK